MAIDINKIKTRSCYFAGLLKLINWTFIATEKKIYKRSVK